MNVAEAIATADDGDVSLWYPADHTETDQYGQTIDDYRTELSEMLPVPVYTEMVKPDGGQPSATDVVVRRGKDVRLRSVLIDDNPVFPSPGCTTITVYPHASRQPRLWRRLLERYTF